jgi:hypothetical protein
VTQAAHRESKFICKCGHAIFSPWLSTELLPAVSQLVSLTFLLIWLPPLQTKQKKPPSGTILIDIYSAA